MVPYHYHHPGYGLKLRPVQSLASLISAPNTGGCSRSFTVVLVHWKEVFLDTFGLPWGTAVVPKWDDHIHVFFLLTVAMDHGIRSWNALLAGPRRVATDAVLPLWLLPLRKTASSSTTSLFYPSTLTGSVDGKRNGAEAP